jgi:hypothetical protein
MASSQAEPTVGSLLLSLIRANQPLSRESFLYALQWGEQMAFWAWRSLPGFQLRVPVLFCGLTAPRDTRGVELILRSVASRIMTGRQGADRYIRTDEHQHPRAVLQTLDLRSEHQNVWFLNPYSSYLPVWNLGEVNWTPRMAQAMASVLTGVPADQVLTPFANAARELVSAAILDLKMRTGSRWILGDLLAAMESPERILNAGDQQSRTRNVLANLLENNSQAGEVLDAVVTNLRPFESFDRITGTSAFGLWLLAGAIPGCCWWQQSPINSKSAGTGNPFGGIA